MPAEWVRAAFDRDGKTYALQPRYRRRVRFELQDIRDAMPEGPFHGILCRNLVFMYFEEGLQREVLRGIRERLLPGGVLAVGTHESLPEETDLVSLGVGLYQRAPDDGKRCGHPLGS